MRQILLVTCLILSSSKVVAAKYQAAGCGLGSLVFENDEAWYNQVLASSLNFTGLQPISITLGISNCDSPAPFRSAQTIAYVEANKIALANDIARGNGETILGLSKVYGCSNYIDFGQALKSNYEEIFTDLERSSMDITHAINGIAAIACNTSI